MDQQEALERLYVITRGIDRDDIESPNGYWETSSGVQRGKQVLSELEVLVKELTA